MDKKQELINELKRIMPCTCLDVYKKIPRADPNCSWHGYGDDIVDFILEYRKKVVAPLVKLERTKYGYIPLHTTTLDAINQTLQNAGISEKDG